MGTVALIGAPGMGPDVSSEAGAVLFFDPIR